jgi:hypothetical protein
LSWAAVSVAGLPVPEVGVVQVTASLAKPTDTNPVGLVDDGPLEDRA